MFKVRDVGRTYKGAKTSYKGHQNVMSGRVETVRSNGLGKIAEKEECIFIFKRHEKEFILSDTAGISPALLPGVGEVLGFFFFSSYILFPKRGGIMAE